MIIMMIMIMMIRMVMRIMIMMIKMMKMMMMMIMVMMMIIMTMMIMTITWEDRRCSMRAMSKANSCAEVGAANSHLRFNQIRLNFEFKLSKSC